MPLSREIIDRTLATPHGEAAYKVTEMLLDAGHECFWVGGAVRDMQLEILPHEIDIATSATPPVVTALFPKSDDSAAHLGTIVVSVKGHTFEVTTFRKDIGIKDGRKPESVQFGTKEEDAARRDATMNAMYWNPISSELFDPWNGAKDCNEKLVRLIGVPEKRIAEDALRILRLVRLRATVDGQYDPKTYTAMKTCASAVNILSGTRVLEEIEKMLLCDHPSQGLQDLLELGVLELILPELAACKGVAQPKIFHHEGDVWNHLLQCASSFTADHAVDVRLAALFHDIGKPKTFTLTDRIHFDKHAEVSSQIAESILRRLQMNRTRVEKISWLIAHHMMMGSFKTLSEERKAHWYFHPWFKELLQVMVLDIEGTTPSDFTLYDEIIKDYDLFLNAHPRREKSLLSGKEVMEILALQEGEQVGKLLQRLHDAQIRKEISTKKEAREFLGKLTAEIEQGS